MTKKDYIIIATALGQACAESNNIKEIERVVEHICHALQVDNPTFDILRFKKHIHDVTIRIMKIR